MGFKPTQVSKLLGTANDAEQAQRIQALRQPCAVITILYDPRADPLGMGAAAQVGVAGGPITYAGLRMILQRVIEGTIQEEAAKRAAVTPAVPGPAQGAPAPTVPATPPAAPPAKPE